MDQPPPGRSHFAHWPPIFIAAAVAESKMVSPGIQIEQAGNICDSRILEMPSGSLGYMVNVVVTNQTSRTLYCLDAELQLPSEGSLFFWLQDPHGEGQPGRLRNQANCGVNTFRRKCQLLRRLQLIRRDPMLPR